MAHVPKEVLAKNFQTNMSAFDHIPGEELYIFPAGTYRGVGQTVEWWLTSERACRASIAKRYGRSKSAGPGSITLHILALTGQNHPSFGRHGEDCGFYGIPRFDRYCSC